MRFRLERKIRELQHNRRIRYMRYAAFSLLACVTVFFIAGALMNPALTMENGEEDHIHSEACYDAEGLLLCTLSETEPDEAENVSPAEEPLPLDLPSEISVAPLWLENSNEDFYSSDLSEFLTDVELIDMDGNSIDLNDPDAVLTVGERYHLFMHFDEDPETDCLKQFAYDSDGFLIYDLDAIGLRFEAGHSVNGDITILYAGSPRVVGHYIFEANTDRHLAEVWFDDVDDRGEPTPGSNFIDQVQDAGFGLDFAVTIDNDSESDDVTLDLGASWSVTLKKDTDVDLAIDKVEDGSDVPYEKRYPKYDEATHSMLYKVVVQCTKGAVDHITYSDSGMIRVHDVEYGLTDADYSNYSDFVITDLDGDFVADGDDFSCLSAASGPISRGDGYIIYYKMKIDPPGREDVLDQSAALNVLVDNTIVAEFQNPSDRDTPCVPVESDTSTHINIVNLTKAGSVSGKTDDSGNKIINWYIIAGDRNDVLTTPFTVEDTISAGHSFYAGIAPTWELMNPDNTIRESGTFTDADFSVSGQRLTFSLPHDTDCRFRVNYSTVVDNNNGGIYSNTAEVPGKNWHVTSALNVAGGVGSMTKEVSDSDSEYVYFTVTADIPHNTSPFDFYFTDKLYSVNESIKIENAAEDFTVRVEYYEDDGTKATRELSEYSTDAEYGADDDEVRFFVGRDKGTAPEQLYAWQMMFFRGKPAQAHNTCSKWFFNDRDCVLTVDYRVPKSAVVFSGSSTTTLREQLAAGRRLTNQVWFDRTYNATVQYTEPLPVTKRGKVEDYADGTLLYEVAFTNDVIPLGETNPQKFLPLCEQFANTVFTDNYDEALEYVPGSLMAFVYRRSDNTQYCYIGSHFGIADNPTSSPNIEAIFRYDGPQPTGNLLNARWEDFLYEEQPENYGYILGHLYRPWGLNAAVQPGMTLEEFANLLKNSSGENDTAVVFLYRLKIKDSYKLAAQLDLKNEAIVKWDLPDSGTYVSPPAVSVVGYDSSLIRKEMFYQDGDVVSYEITINPRGTDLTENDVMLVKDEMCEFLSPYMASLRVYTGTPGTPEPVWDEEIDPHALHDPEKNTITMTLPDDVPLRITYNCLILGAEVGDQVPLANSVNINGMPDSVQVNNATIAVTAGSSTGTGKNHYMFLQKQDDGANPLNGAVFALYGHKETHQASAPEGIAQEITYKGVQLYYYSLHTTQDDTENIYLHGVFRLDETNDGLEDKGLFALVEVEPPEGFGVNPDPMYFYWLEKPDDALDGVEVYRHEKDYAFVDGAQSYVMPNTGSSGGLVMRMLAIFCFAAAAILVLPQIRRKCGMTVDKQ